MKTIVNIVCILSLGLLVQCQAASVVKSFGADDISETSKDTGHEELGTGIEYLATDNLKVGPGLEEFGINPLELDTGLEKAEEELMEEIMPMQIVEEDAFYPRPIIEEPYVELMDGDSVKEEIKEVEQGVDNIMEEVRMLGNRFEEDRKSRKTPKPNAAIPAEHNGLFESKDSKYTLDSMRLIFFVSAGVLTLLVFLLLIMLLVTLIKRVHDGPRYRYLGTATSGQTNIIKRVRLVPANGKPPKPFLTEKEIDEMS